MSFVRRFSSFPSTSVISQIEGVVIVDATPPAPIEGVNTGVVGVVGEFADMTYAVSVDGSGNVATKAQPVEVTSAQDMVNKVGGWDATIGDFGGDDGNGFATVDGKRFSRLVICPVNLASSKAVRLWRELPTNKSATSATPVVPMQPGFVPAGTEFKVGSHRVKLGKSVTFTADLPIVAGSNGVQTAETGATVTFTSTAGDFINKGVQVGDALVVGVIGGAGNPGTYRIAAVTSATSLEVEALDGSNITWGGASALVYRIHPASTFDTGVTVRSGVAGFSLPARPLDAAINPDLALAASNPAADATATSWQPLSGLRMATQTGVGNGLAYNADVQAVNAATTADLRALYDACFEALLIDAYPARDVSILISSRTDSLIRNAMKTHVLTASSQGRGRMAVVAPSVSMVSKETAISDEEDGVGYTRDERVIYCWPAVRMSMPNAVNSRVKLADGTYTTEGILDIRADVFMASILSNLNAERNPGQATDPVPLCLSPVLSFQSGLPVDGYSMSDYIQFRQNGVAAIRFDRSAGKTFQSGITSSIISGQKNINRRRMADEIQDSLASVYEKFSKLPLTGALKDVIDMETVAYLDSLLSFNNPAAQRIEAYSVDSKSGNTPELNAAGIYVVIVRVRMLATADDIVLQAEVGPTVNVTAA